MYMEKKVVDHIKSIVNISKAYGVSKPKMKLRKWLSRNACAEFCSLRF